MLRYDQSNLEVEEVEGDTSIGDASACLADVRIPGGCGIELGDLTVAIKEMIDAGWSVEDVQIVGIHTNQGTEVTVRFQSYPTTATTKLDTLQLIEEGHIMEREINPKLYQILGQGLIRKRLETYALRHAVIECNNRKFMAAQNDLDLHRSFAHIQSWCSDCKHRPHSMKYCDIIKGLLQATERGGLLSVVLPGMTIEEIQKERGV